MMSKAEFLRKIKVAMDLMIGGANRAEAAHKVGIPDAELLFPIYVCVANPQHNSTIDLLYCIEAAWEEYLATSAQ